MINLDNIFNYLDTYSNNLRVMCANGFINNVLYANEDDQTCLITRPDANGYYIQDESGGSKIFRYHQHFWIENTLSGKGDKPSVSTLKDTKQNRRCLVLGSGPSLRESLEKVMRMPSDVVISINVRPLEVLGYPPDYIVYIDDVVSDMIPISHRNVPTVSIWSSSSSYYLDWLEVQYWNKSFSSALAVWLGCFLGCKDIVLLGFDCYQGKAYCDDKKNDAIFKNYPMEVFNENWREAKIKCVNSNRISVVDSPLSSVFRKY